MILTSNYGLNKPEGTDLVDVDDFNANVDIIDAELKALADEMTSVKKSVSDGKTTVAEAITAQGVETAADADYDTMAANVTSAGALQYDAGVAATQKGTATAAHVLSGYTFTNSSDVEIAGSMKNLSTSASTTYSTSNTTPVVVGDAMFFAANSDGVQRCCIRTGANNVGYVNSNTLFAYPMVNRGAWTSASSGSGNITIPAGYHNGSGYVSCAGAYNAGVTAGAAGKTAIQTGSISVYANGSTYRITFNSASNFCFHLKTGGITDVSANVTMQTTTYVDIVVKAYYGNEGTYTLQWIAW